MRETEDDGTAGGDQSDASGMNRRDLKERDLWLRLALDLLRDMRLVLGLSDHLCLRQIDRVGDRQARRIIGNRQCHCDLTIVLLAEPTAILPRDADQMDPFFVMPVSSTILTSAGHFLSMEGRTRSRTLPKTALL
jgi:hypothetical protein